MRGPIPVILMSAVAILSTATIVNGVALQTGAYNPPAIQSASGPPGANGVDGSDGKDGKIGKPGKDGKDGKDGLNGKDGQDGKTGKTGKTGKAGKTGPAGKTTKIPSQTVSCDAPVGQAIVGVKVSINAEGRLVLVCTTVGVHTPYP